MVKYTCKSYSRNVGSRGAREWTQGEERVDRGGKKSKRRGDKEKQGLSQVVHSAKQVLDKHMESKQSQCTPNGS